MLERILAMNATLCADAALPDAPVLPAAGPLATAPAVLPDIDLDAVHEQALIRLGRGERTSGQA